MVVGGAVVLAMDEDEVTLFEDAVVLAAEVAELVLVVEAVVAEG